MRAKESQSAAAVVKEDVCEKHLNEAENKVTMTRTVLYHNADRG